MEHFVVRGLDSWHKVPWGESDLFYLGVVVSWVSVQSELAYLNEGVIFVGPDLSDVQDIESIVRGVSLWHDLDLEIPNWEIFLVDSLKKILSGIIWILGSELLSLFISQRLLAFPSLEVEFDKVNLVLVINPLKSVASIPVLESITVWGSLIREQDSDLMGGFWGQTQKIPKRIWVLKVGLRVPFLGVDKIWEL